MAKPSIFVASSSEGLSVAEAIAQNLDQVCEWKLWSQGVFQPGKYYLETLIEELSTNDFAVMVLTNDDSCVSRGKEANIPRDNVLFELGMFIGRLGRERTFIILDKSAKLKMPSDLAGLTSGTFDPPGKVPWRNAVSAACIDIKNIIKKLGPINQEYIPNKFFFPKDLVIIEDVSAVLTNNVLPIIRDIALKGERINIENFGLDLESVMPWIKTTIVHDDHEFDDIDVSIKSLIINPKSPYLKGIIDGESNVSSSSISSSIKLANDLKNHKSLYRFELEIKQYDLAPIAHGFIINNTHIFLGFTEIEDDKLIGGIKPYIYLDKQQHSNSIIGSHYFSSFKSWFDYYWSISKTVANVKK